MWGYGWRAFWADTAPFKSPWREERELLGANRKKCVSGHTCRGGSRSGGGGHISCSRASRGHGAGTAPGSPQILSDLADVENHVGTSVSPASWARGQRWSPSSYKNRQLTQSDVYFYSRCMVRCYFFISESYFMKYTTGGTFYIRKAVARYKFVKPER